VRASCSRRLERDVEELGRCFPVLEAFGNNAESEGLDAGHHFITILPVAEHAGQSGTSAIQRPSSSRSSSIVKVTCVMYHPAGPPPTLAVVVAVSKQLLLIRLFQLTV
jgi:hypothetical protein